MTMSSTRTFQVKLKGLGRSFPKIQWVQTNDMMRMRDPITPVIFLNPHSWTPRHFYSKLQDLSIRYYLELHRILVKTNFRIFNHSKQKKGGISLVWISEFHNIQSFSQHKQQRKDNAQPPHTSFTKCFRLIDVIHGLSDSAATLVGK